MMIRNALTAAAVVSLLAACAGTPTAPLGDQLPAGPSFDGGFMMGSGSRDSVPSTEESGASSEASDAELLLEESGGTSNRSGHLFGSGS